MAIFHLSVRVVSRSKGQSAVHKAAYNARTQLADERHGLKTKNYAKEGEILFSGIFAPKNAPTWAQDREQLWNRAEVVEKRKDAQLAREVEIALPHELTAEQRERLVKDFVREQFVRRGMIADVAIHAPDKKGDQRNHHAHILLTTRPLDGDGFGAKKREWNSKATLQEWREAWDRTANRYLERFGHEARIDHRTLGAQGIDREPGIHIGVHAAAMEAQGITTERGEQFREIEGRNRERVSLKQELREMEGGERTYTVPSFTPSPLKSADRVASRMLDGFATMAERLLDFFVGAPSPSVPATEAEARAARVREKMGGEIAERKRSEALDRLGRDQRAGRNLNPEELRYLSPTDLQGIKAHGEAGLHDLIRQHEEERRRRGQERDR